MSWFDILKLSGEDFGRGTVRPDNEDYYGDTKTPVADYFYSNVKLHAITRPHYEGQLSSEKGEGAVGNLKTIVQKIGGKGDTNTLYYVFTDPENDAHVVTFRKLDIEKDLTGSKPRVKLGNRHLTGKILNHKKDVIVFDSIYPMSGFNRIKKIKARYLPIWDGDYQRLGRAVSQHAEDKSIGRTDVVTNIKERKGGLTKKEGKELADLMETQRRASKKGIFDDNFRKRKERIDELKRKRDGLDDN
tara:strand:+ start:214 stop:948 length:735 start_codon:yes stop_codon:yes gene_type:complete